MSVKQERALVLLQRGETATPVSALSRSQAASCPLGTRDALQHHRAATVLLAAPCGKANKEAFV